MTIKYYWGIPDASVHFCENKYEKIIYISEFWNTISSFSFIVMGLLLLKYREKRICFGLIGIGIGSVLLHMTSRHFGQWIDEISMLIVTFIGIQEYKKTISSLFLFPIIILYLLFSKYFILFFLVFVIANIYIAYRSFVKACICLSIKQSILIYLYLYFLILGSTCWLLDQFYCETFINNQLHAWWHIFTSLAGFCAILALFK